MNRINALFEEDIEMQDAIDDMNDGLADESDELMTQVMVNHTPEEKIHLFVDDVPVDKEERDKLESELIGDFDGDGDVDDTDLEEFIDDDDF